MPTVTQITKVMKARGRNAPKPKLVTFNSTQVTDLADAVAHFGGEEAKLVDALNSQLASTAEATAAEAVFTLERTIAETAKGMAAITKKPLADVEAAIRASISPDYGNVVVKVEDAPEEADEDETEKPANGSPAEVKA